jgi:hypothetical protein
MLRVALGEQRGAKRAGRLTVVGGLLDSGLRSMSLATTARSSEPLEMSEKLDVLDDRPYPSWSMVHTSKPNPAHTSIIE